MLLLPRKVYRNLLYYFYLSCQCSILMRELRSNSVKIRYEILIKSFLKFPFAPEYSRFQQKLLPQLCSPVNLHCRKGLDPLWALINDYYAFEILTWNALGLVCIGS